MLTLFLPQQPSKQPLAGDAQFRYVPAQANLVMQIDVQTIGSHALETLSQLGQQPFVSEVPRMARVHRRLNRNIQKTLNKFRRQMGFDPIKQVRGLTFAAQLNIHSPQFLATIHGRWNETLVASILRALSLQAEPIQADHFTVYVSPNDRQPSLAWSQDALLIGHNSLLKLVLQQQQPASDSLGARMARRHKGDHLLSLGYQPGATELAMLGRTLGPFQKLATSLQGLYLAVSPSGSKLSLQANDQATAARYRSLLAGIGLIATAGESLKDATFQFLDALLDPSDEQLPSIFRALAPHKKAFFAFLENYIGKQKISAHASLRNTRAQLAMQGRGTAFVFLASAASIFIPNLVRSRRSPRVTPVYPTRPPRVYRYHESPKSAKPPPPPADGSLAPTWQDRKPPASRPATPR